MKTFNFLNQIFTLLFAITLLNTAQAQLFETTIGDAADVENTWDGKQLPNGNFIMLSNTLSFGTAFQIMLTELDPAGNVVNVASLYDPANPNTTYFGMAMELEYDAAGNHVGYYITGHAFAGNVDEMILIKTDPAGYMIWANKLNNVANGTVYKESGISIELQANKDVVVIGRSRDLNTGIEQIVASRVDATGATVWARRYGTTVANANFIPNESCNGKRQLPFGLIDVVAVTGKYEENGVVNTFVSLLNANSGFEVFRKIYVSNGTKDQGNAIVQHPTTYRYMVVCESLDGGGNTDLWVANLNGVNGNLVFANHYDLGVLFPVFRGRDVCLSLTNNTAVIAGMLRENSIIGAVSRTFTLELPFSSIAVPAWFYSYTDSDPNPQGTESINAVQAPVGGINGYFITTDAFLTGAPSTDQHAIRVDGGGLHNIGTCPEIAQAAVRNAGGQFYSFAKNYTTAAWNAFDLETAARDLTEEPCVPPITNGNISERSSNDNDFELANSESMETKVFPNPVLIGTDATLSLNLESEGTVEVTVIDVTGRMAFAKKVRLESGSQQISIPTNDFNSGTYFVRVISDKKHSSHKLYVQK